MLFLRNSKEQSEGGGARGDEGRDLVRRDVELQGRELGDPGVRVTTSHYRECSHPGPRIRAPPTPQEMPREKLMASWAIPVQHASHFLKLLLE